MPEKLAYSIPFVSKTARLERFFPPRRCKTHADRNLRAVNERSERFAISGLGSFRRAHQAIDDDAIKTENLDSETDEHRVDIHCGLDASYRIKHHRFEEGQAERPQCPVAVSCLVHC